MRKLFQGEPSLSILRSSEERENRKISIDVQEFHTDGKIDLRLRPYSFAFDLAAALLQPCQNKYKFSERKLKFLQKQILLIYKL